MVKQKKEHDLLKERSDTLEADLAATKEAAGDETDMKALKSQLDAKTEEMERLRRQFEDVKMNEIKRLQAKLLEEQQASDAAGKEKLKAIEQVAELKGEVEVLSSELAKAQSDLTRVIEADEWVGSFELRLEPRAYLAPPRAALAFSDDHHFGYKGNWNGGRDTNSSILVDYT